MAITINALENTSFYGNFGATDFDFAAEKNFLKHDICQTCATLADGCDEIWHFGTNPVLKSDTVAQIVFGRNNIDQSSLDDLTGKRIDIPVQSWALTTDLLLKQAGEKRIFVSLTQSFLQQLSDPRPILLALKKLLLKSQALVHIVVSDSGKSTRTWRSDEFQQFLTASGFELSSSQHIGVSKCLTANITENTYSSYLKSMGFNSKSLQASRLLVATENSQVFPAGGIGTLVGNISKLDQNSITLLMDEQNRKFDTSGYLVNIRSIIPNFDVDMVIRGTTSVLVEAVKALLFCFPNVKRCDFPDYQSLGYRLVQAKQTGQLPMNLQMVALLVGAVDYIKHGVQNSNNPYYSWQDAKYSIMDAYVTEHADLCISPSEYYAKLLIEEYGYKISNLSIRRLPLDIGWIKPNVTPHYDQVKKIVFLGKFNELKGWPEFVEALFLLKKRGVIKKGMEIVALGPGAPAKELVLELKKSFKFSHTYLSHADYLKFVEGNAHSSLYVLPSRGESYSYIAQELALLGLRFVAYNQAAMPETLWYKNLPKSSLCAPGAQSLAAAINEHLVEQLSGPAFDPGLLRSEAKKIQKEANKLWFEEPGIETTTDSKGTTLGTVSVVTPFFNTELSFMRQLYSSLESSSLKPIEWLIVNDGSSESNAKALETWTQTLKSDFEIRIVSKENGGLSSARNRGLQETKSDFAYVIDSDDIMTVNGLEDAAVALTLNENLICTTGMIHYFFERSDLKKIPSATSSGEYWSPIGIPEARVLSLHENQYIHAGVMVRTNQFIASGGWDAKDKSTWEDWALYERLAWGGHKFSLIPSPGYLYRDTPNSMSKTYNRYLGVRRLARNIPGLSTRDASILLSLSRMNSEASAPPNSAADGLSPTLQFYRELIHSKHFHGWLNFHKTIAAVTPKSAKRLLGKFLGF